LRVSAMISGAPKSVSCTSASNDLLPDRLYLSWSTAGFFFLAASSNRFT
jgi:hypothetical protein